MEESYGEREFGEPYEPVDAETEPRLVSRREGVRAGRRGQVQRVGQEARAHQPDGPVLPQHARPLLLLPAELSVRLPVIRRSLAPIRRLRLTLLLCPQGVNDNNNGGSNITRKLHSSMHRQSFSHNGGRSAERRLVRYTCRN